MITTQTLSDWNTPSISSFNKRVTKAALLIAVSNNAPAAYEAFKNNTLEEWDALSNYTEGDFVSHEGLLYRALSDNTGTEPEQLEETETQGVFTTDPVWRYLGLDNSSLEGSTFVHRWFAPFAVQGYYPLYSSAQLADEASPTNEHHTHVLDGEAYYMPTGGVLGVDFFHGDYVEPDTDSSDSSDSGSSSGY